MLVSLYNKLNTLSYFMKFFYARNDREEISFQFTKKLVVLKIQCCYILQDTVYIAVTPHNVNQQTKAISSGFAIVINLLSFFKA